MGIYIYDCIVLFMDCGIMVWYWLVLKYVGVLVVKYDVIVVMLEKLGWRKWFFDFV